MKKDTYPYHVRDIPESVLRVQVYEVPSSHAGGWIGVHGGDPGLTVTSRWGGRVINTYPSVETDTCRNVWVQLHLVRAAFDLTFMYAPDAPTPIQRIARAIGPTRFAHYDSRE